jgi:putative DNA methylase
LAGIDSGRPASYGFTTVGELFSPRQQLVLSEAFAWVRRRNAPEAIKEALLLALSNSLGSNNLLCGYATDYGRLSSLFSGVRAYSMPVLSVELNPLHETGGRGTLTMTIQRMLRSQNAEVSRHTYHEGNAEIVRHRFPARPADNRRHVVCRSADRPFPEQHGKLDLVVTDPPYYDFIPYSDLSLLYRA